MQSEHLMDASHCLHALIATHAGSTTLFSITTLVWHNSHVYPHVFLCELCDLEVRDARTGVLVLS
jgi:hypothetical protein